MDSLANEPGLRIVMLGRFRVFTPLAEIRGIARHRVRSAVLAYVAVCEEVTRDRLIGTFWPERTEARARHALSQVLHKLRRDLGVDWLEMQGEVLELGRSVEVDARAFERAVQDHDHDAAMRLYRGPFLDGWCLPCTHAFELWVDGQRSRCARLHAIACRELAREKESAGDLDAAIAAIRQWSDMYPLDESAHLEIVRLLVRSGRRSEAVRRHRDFLARLAADELETSADLTTRVNTLLRPSSGANLSFSAALTDRPASEDAAPSVGWRARERVQVVPLENLTGDARFDALGRLAADWITEGLDRAGIGKIVPLLDGLRLADTTASPGEADHAQAAMPDFGLAAGAGTLVTGSYSRVGGSLEFRAHVVDLQAGQLHGAVEPVRTSNDGESGALSLLRDRVLGLIAAVLDTDWTGLPTSPELGLPPPTYAAYRAYATGLEHFVRQQFARAIPWLREAMTIDPEFKRPTFLAAAAHMNLGEWESAASLIASLRSARDRLCPFELSGLDWHEASLAGDRIAAYEVSIRGWRRYPGTIAHFLAGLESIRVNRPREAIQVLRDLQPGRGWLRDFHAYWEVLTSAHHMLGDHRAEVAAARRGREQFPTLCALLACEVRALAPGGISSEIEDRLAEAPDLPPQPGWSPGRITLLAAVELRAHGHEAAAARLAERAARCFEEEALARPFGSSARGELARALCLAERWTEAEKILEELAPQYPQNIEYRGRLAALETRRGDRAAAARGDRELQQLARPYLFGLETAWRARVAAQLGDPDRAIRMLVRAFVEGHPHGVDLHADPDLEPLRTHEAFRRLLRPKG